jgi:hypothetical protein
MSLYKYSKFVQVSNHNAFDSITEPGNSTPYSGLYCCEGCGHEIAANYGNPMPPQNHHQHNTSQGSIRWRLIVATAGN